jgi:hypothetical protein
MMDEIRIRKPDYDLEAYLENNRALFELEDIYNLHANIPGHNDEDSWYWILELRDGRFLLVQASCDYTGWDCQSSGASWEAPTASEAALLAPEREDSTAREIRRNLLAQLSGEQPFGIEVS